MDISVTGGTGQPITGFMPPVYINRFGRAGFNIYDLYPQQLVGFYPMFDCNQETCKEWCDYKHKLMVHVDIDDVLEEPFYTTVGLYNPDSIPQNDYNYKNDKTTFLFNLFLITGNGFKVTTKWTFEKYSKIFGRWDEIDTLMNLLDTEPSSSAWLKHYPQGFFTKNTTYEGLTIDWAYLFSKGFSRESSIEGNGFKTRSQIWRIKFEVEYYDETTGGLKNTCMRSCQFEVFPYSCSAADGTIKFEKWISGLVGDPYQDYIKHNLCNITIYDSVRMDGWIGKEKIDEYRTENVKHGSPFTGKIEHVRDEAIQKWDCGIWYQPHYIHKRFSSFGLLMSTNDLLLASDYNISNSHDDIKRLNVNRDSNYPTEFIDNFALNKRIDKSKVNIIFKRGVQSLYKYTCCDNKIGTGG